MTAQRISKRIVYSSPGEYVLPPTLVTDWSDNRKQAVLISSSDVTLDIPYLCAEPLDAWERACIAAGAEFPEQETPELRQQREMGRVEENSRRDDFRMQLRAIAGKLTSASDQALQLRAIALLGDIPPEERVPRGVDKLVLVAIAEGCENVRLRLGRLEGAVEYVGTNAGANHGLSVEALPGGAMLSTGHGIWLSNDNGGPSKRVTFRGLHCRDTWGVQDALRGRDRPPSLEYPGIGMGSNLFRFESSDVTLIDCWLGGACFNGAKATQGASGEPFSLRIIAGQWPSVTAQGVGELSVSAVQLLRPLGTDPFHRGDEHNRNLVHVSGEVAVRVEACELINRRNAGGWAPGAAIQANEWRGGIPRLVAYGNLFVGFDRRLTSDKRVRPQHAVDLTGRVEFDDALGRGTEVGRNVRRDTLDNYYRSCRIPERSDLA